jgi:tetratricopeptide (TPR) repeat protein
MAYFNLGTYSRRVSTENTEAQIWFDRGLVWSYAFNHDEAVECFEKASKADPKCVMAWWGIAYSIGPNYNKPWEMFDENELEVNIGRAKKAISTAQEAATASNSTEVERALIDAIQYRFQNESKDRSTWHAEYTQAMEKVYQRFGDDIDVAALYADALMNLTPWSLWDLQSGEPAAGSRTSEAKAVLDRALQQQGGMTHPGLLHLYIHMIEMSSRPEDGLFAADALRTLVPDGGHLHHMPTHLDV